MSVLSVPPSRLAQSGSALARTARSGPARALRLELKRSAVPWVLPLLAAVFYFDALRTADGFPPVWAQRASVIPEHMSWAFGVFAAGLAAWAGSREGRRKTLDLVGTTPRAAWARQSVALAGTLCWVLLAFLAGVAVIYGQTALQGAWGGPPLWPVFVGVACVTVVTVLGFAAGVFFPGRFTAPLAAILVFVLFQVGFRQVLSITPSSGTYALLSPDNAPPPVDAGTYYHVAPDVPVVQVMFMAGLAVALFGVLGLAQGLGDLGLGGGRGALRAVLARGDGWLVRAAAAVLVAGGVAASAVAFSLAGTARPDTATGGWQIAALHTAATDQPVPYAPDCSTSGSGFQVCVHPAFGFYLHQVAAELDPVAAEIAGLPGAPVAARELPSQSGGQEVLSGLTGNPPVFEYTADHVGAYFGLFFGFDPVGWQQGFQEGLLDAFLEAPASPGPSSGLSNGPAQLDAAQQAVEDALLAGVGSPPLGASAGHTASNGKLSEATLADIEVAAQRFGALSASARHAWLATHLAALRAGTVTLAQLP
jgi:hypothetical protein